jgi:hypothetical protein|tara:strand:+ start:580 stop:948 length:369 start_codon:yes stop_codon:yes gene_type:complete
MNHGVLAQSLAVAAAATALDPIYTDLVRELIAAQRRVDFHVDAADALDAAARSGSGSVRDAAAAAARLRIHEKHEELWSNACGRIKAALPQREIKHAHHLIWALRMRRSSSWTDVINHSTEQ